MKKREDTGLNSSVTAFANHSLSLVSGIMVFATVYALIPLQAGEVISEPGPHFLFVRSPVVNGQ